MIHIVQTPEMVSLYVKQWEGVSPSYLRFQLLHNVDLTNSEADKRHDVWRMNQILEVVKEADGSYRTLRPITNQGEWETAIREVGAGDSMGGRIHANEFLREARLLLDGSEGRLGSAAELLAESVILEQRTKLTRYGSNNEVIAAEKQNRWTITSSELILDQQIEWKTGMEINSAFLTMLPILRKEPGGVVTDTGARAPEWEPEDISEEGFEQRYSQAHHAKAWSDVSGVCAEIEIVQGWTFPNRRFFFSSAALYNKMYFDFTGPITTLPGDVWRIRSVYRIRVLPR